MTGGRAKVDGAEPRCAYSKGAAVLLLNSQQHRAAPSAGVARAVSSGCIFFVKQDTYVKNARACARRGLFPQAKPQGARYDAPLRRGRGSGRSTRGRPSRRETRARVSRDAFFSKNQRRCYIFSKATNSECP